MNEALWKKRYHLLFAIRRSILYHCHRQKFFDGLHLANSAVNLIFGSATFFVLFGGTTNATVSGGTITALMVTAFITTMFSVFNLVVGFTRRSCQHNVLASKFMELEKRFIAVPEMDFMEEDLRRFTIERLDIEIGEPPKKAALDSICHNELLKAEGIKDPKQVVKITRLQRLLAHFCTYDEEALDKPI